MAHETNVRVRLVSDAFPCENLQVRRLRGEESLGAPYWFDVDVAIKDPAGLDAGAVLGADVTILFEHEQDPPRRVHGTVASFTDYLRTDEQILEYGLRVVPRVHRLALTQTYEVFLGMSVPDIIANRLARAGLQGPTDVVFQLTGSYTPRDLVVQYGESDLALVSRLAEHAGITMRFDQAEGRDRVVFSDSNAHFTPVEGGPLVFDVGSVARRVLDVRTTRSLVPTSFVVVDYNDQHPRLDLRAPHAPPGSAEKQRAIVEYGSYHRTREEGTALARIRAEERACEDGVYEGSTSAYSLEPGRTFTVAEHPRLRAAPLLVVDLTHEAVQPLVFDGHAAPGERVEYRNKFRARPLDPTYRPRRRTPRPRIAGVLHAITEGVRTATNKRIANIDDQGRYSVRFYFDMSPDTARPASSPPLRMLQPHAGPGYGMHFPLKPDVEVLVAFVDGDPDRPVIVGAVPNPLTGSPVTSRNPQAHKLTTSNGLFIVMKDL